MSLSPLILTAIQRQVASEPALRALKSEHAGISGVLPTNSELLATYQKLITKGQIKTNPALERLLTKRKVRSLSGVSVIAVLTKPFGCPGRCSFCPSAAGMPKSYLPSQPGAMRALRNEFDPFRQVTERLASLQACGHPTTKIELIILGGTWTALPRAYQTWFVRRCLLALNSFGVKKSKRQSQSLAALQQANESAPNRLVGLTIETRPDWLSLSEVERQRQLGVTRVELGAQSIYDSVLRHTRRGHNTAHTIAAITRLKDAGLKVGLHLMPGLPKSSQEMDIAMFREVFLGTDYCPDQIKIYPCSVLAGTLLERQWQRGEYQPLDEKQVLALMKKIYPLVPEYCRVSRVVRDIPSGDIVAGSRLTNLRQELEKLAVPIRDIRARELKENRIKLDKIQLIEREYTASNGREIFISLEDTQQDKLISFARLRLPSDSRIAFIREVHSYGSELCLGQIGESGQHRGFGKQVIARAEALARETGYAEIRIPAGVGVRPYYYKLGYKLKNHYVVKKI